MNPIELSRYIPQSPRMPNYPRLCFPNTQWRFNYGPRVSSWSNQTQSIIDRNEEHWCETCDRGFPNAVILEKHKNQHEKCNIDGCGFVAHPKIITKHIQMQHSTGLYKKIAKLNNPEEIKTWREERRRNYPTQANIEKKAAMVREKIERGEKMGLSRDKNMCDNKKSGMNRKYKSDNRKFNNKCELNRRKPIEQKFKANQKPSQTPFKKTKVLPVLDDKRSIKPFSGIQDILSEIVTPEDIMETEKFDLGIEDDDVSEENVPNTKTNISSESTVCNALSSLICEYGSSDDDETTVSKENIIDKCNQNSETNGNLHKVNSEPKSVAIPNLSVPAMSEHKRKDSKSCLLDVDDDGPEEIAILKKDITELTPDIIPDKKSVPIEKKEKIKSYPTKVIKKPPRSRVPSTLLQKLLFKEVKQERNIILQCIRHIRKNNYFTK